jgi:hypothetical protein
MKKKSLMAILALGLILRLVSLSELPYGFTPDEASFGYDAYSIIQTGRDQWGERLPLVFKSFGDYKAPFYTYLSIPSVYFFGLNKFVVGLPNVLFGTLAIYSTYLITKELATSVDWVDQIPHYTLGNYSFKQIDCSVARNQDALLVGRPEEFPGDVLATKEFEYPNGEEAILIVDPLSQAYAKAN